MSIRIVKTTWSLQDDPIYHNIALCLFASGCKWHCKGCSNKQLWDFNNPDAYDVTAERIAKYITSKGKYIPAKDISIVGLGGDFWFQKEAYLECMQKVKELVPDVKIVWFTGAEYDKKHIDNSLDIIDVILWGALKNRDGKVYKQVSKASLGHDKIIEIEVNDYDDSFE